MYFLSFHILNQKNELMKIKWNRFKVVNSSCLLGIFKFYASRTVHFLSFHILNQQNALIKVSN